MRHSCEQSVLTDKRRGVCWVINMGGHPSASRQPTICRNTLLLVVTFDIQSNRRLGTLFPWITGDHWMCVSPEGHIRGGHFAPDQTKFDPADTAIPASLKDQIVYVALFDDGSQVHLSPDEFAARFGWKNDPNQAYLLGPTP